MTEPPVVRVAGPGDAAAVGALQVASWQAGYAGLLPSAVLAALDPAELGDVWRRSLEQPPSPRHRLLVAGEGARLVGFAAVGPCEDPDADDHVAELLVLGVHPQARLKGHGGRLVRTAAADARAWGATALVAWVPHSDERTREFLQRAGLVPDSARRDRVVDADGRCLREVRLVADVADLAGQEGDVPEPLG